jgi:hypothetical protein
VELRGEKQTKASEQQGQQKDQQSDKRLGSSLPNLLGEKPARVSNLGRKCHGLSQSPWIAGICWFQSKQYVLGPLEQFVGRGVAKAHIGLIVREETAALCSAYCSSLFRVGSASAQLRVAKKSQFSTSALGRCGKPKKPQNRVAKSTIRLWLVGRGAFIT